MSQSRWRGTTDFVKDLGEYAKFIALLLAIAGFLALYFPDLRRWWELRVEPTNWFYIGSVRPNRLFYAKTYQHPLWNDGAAIPVERLRQLPESILITEGQGLHVGRRQPTATAPVRANYGAGVCLNVRGLESRTSAGDPIVYMWASAQRVTC